MLPHLDVGHSHIPSESVMHTVSWFPSKVHLPRNSSHDLITTSLQDIAYALLHPTTRSPVAPLTATHKAALQQLLEILSPPGWSHPPTPLSPPA